MSRYEQEIKDILEKIEDFLPPGQEARQVRKKPGFLEGWRRKMSGFRFAFTPGQIFVAGLILVGVAYFLSFFVRGVTPYIGVAGGLLIAVSYLMYLTGKRSHPYQKRWRGQVIDLEERREGSWRYYWWRIKRMFTHR